MLIDGGGKIIRLSPKEIRTMGRQAKGVRLIRLEEGQKLATVVAFREDDKVEGQDDPEAGGEVDPKKEIQAKIKAAAREIKQASLNGDSQDLESIDSVNLDGEFALEDQAVDGFDASEDDQILDSSSQDQDIFNQF